MPLYDGYKHLKLSFHFNFTIIKPLLPELWERTLATLDTSTGLLQVLPLTLGKISFGIIFTFLNKILLEILIQVLAYSNI